MSLVHPINVSSRYMGFRIARLHSLVYQNDFSAVHTGSSVQGTDLIFFFPSFAYGLFLISRPITAAVLSVPVSPFFSYRVFFHSQIFDDAVNVYNSSELRDERETRCLTQLSHVNRGCQ